MSDFEQGQPRPIGRELDEIPRKPGARRLHVDRPCYVCRRGRGHWSWQCSYCPLPHRLTSNPAGSWQEAVDEADRHIRTMHATVSEPASAAPASTTPWELAA